MPKVLLILGAYSIVLIGGSLALLQRGPYYGNGNGLFVLIGFFYLIPLKFVYKQSLGRTLIVVCSGWIYTMLVFSISVHIAKLFPEPYFSLAAFLAQTVLLLLTAWPFNRFVRNQFLYVLQNISLRTEVYLRALSLMWFATAILLNFTFVFDNNALFKLLSLLLLAADAWLSYYLIHLVVKNAKDVESLEKTVCTDYLTGLQNRTGLFQAAEIYMRNQQPFLLLFLDLDRFKSVNDRYGHMTGDAYLRQFAQRFSRFLGSRGELYRFSGDEFICLCPGASQEDIQQLIQQERWDYQVDGHDFCGFSYGCAAFPEDSSSLDKLIALADRQMYLQKSGDACTQRHDIN